MEIEKLAKIQKIIEVQEETNANGKIIIFFENGELKAIEITNKVKIT